MKVPRDGYSFSRIQVSSLVRLVARDRGIQAGFALANLRILFSRRLGQLSRGFPLLRRD